MQVIFLFINPPFFFKNSCILKQSFWAALMIEGFTGKLGKHLGNSVELNKIRKLLEARSNQELHCLPLDASICDTDTKCCSHFFKNGK